MNNNKYMTMDDIMNFIEEMSKSRGLYGRLLLRLLSIKENEPEKYKEIEEKWKNKFKNPLDFVLYFEC